MVWNVESLARKDRRRPLRRGARLPILKHLRLRWPGNLLAVFTPLLVLLCHFLLTARNQGQAQQMVEELGSILVFAGRPLPNHACTKLVFSIRQR